MKVILINLMFLSSLILFGCKNNSKTNRINDFDSFIKAIPLIDLPYSTTCGSCCQSVKLDLDSSFIQKYELDGSEVVGKLSETDKYIAILVAGGADYYVPVIFVYDKKRRFNFKTAVYGQLLWTILGFYGNYYLDIDKQLQITEIDTALVFKTDTVEFKIIDTLKRDISVTKFMINEQGKIIKK